MIGNSWLQKGFRLLASLRLTTALIAAMFLWVLWGTVLETRSGIWEAQRLVFGNWWGGVPFLCVLASFNLVAASAIRFRWTLGNSGLLLAHAGLLSLLISGGLGMALSNSSRIDIGPGEMTSEARFPGKWEVVLTANGMGAGAISKSIPLQGVHSGDVLDFGPEAGKAVLRAFVANGTIGAQSMAISLPSPPDPTKKIPALVLEWTEGPHRSNSVTLDRNRPMAAAGERTMVFLQEAAEPLPFRIALREFKRETHPGSTRPKSFESHVVVSGPGESTQEAVIRMNHPLRRAGFTFYQSSWRTDDRTGAERSVFAVVRNPVGSWPYWSTLLIGLGLALHFLPRMRPKPKSVAAALLVLATAAGASTPVKMPPTGHVPPALRELPVQIDGRVKTFETFARHALLQISGRSTIGNADAATWLATLVLDPDRLAETPVFLIENPDTRDALGLEGKDRDRHSWKALDKASSTLSSLASMAGSKQPEARNALDREVLRLSDAWFRYRGLAMSLAFLRTGSVSPMPGRAPPVPTFLQLALNADSLAGVLDSLAGMDSTRRTPEQTAVLAWFRNTFGIAAVWDEAEFPVVPVRDSLSAAWGTPSSLVLKQGLESPALRQTALEWDALRIAWLSGDTAGSQQAATALRDSVLARGGAGIRPRALQAETLHNAANPFLWANVLFFLGFVPAAFGAWNGRKILCRVGDLLSASAMLLLLAGMGLRMVVTLRPPVTNLYETVLFVCAVAVPSLLLPSLRRGWLAGSALGALTGFALLLLARAFGVDGDTMPVLVAVLDSNFWLTIHVITITIGYGTVLAAGIAAHWHLWRWRRGSKEPSDVVRLLAGWGLFFTFVGTLLGGIWADQSWGRFWGWDPKENGALLIVLWTAGTFHARLSGLVGARGFSAWTAAGISTVLFAWFGVNLLGVGLHSYGFTEGTFRGLVLWAVAETAFLTWALWSPKKV